MKRKIIIFVVLTITIIVAVFGIFEYYNCKEIIEGCFFRKMYGSVGIVDSNDYIIKLDLFCFNTNADFLRDSNKLFFDNNNVSIMNVEYEEQNREEDLVVYSVNFRISINNKGQHDVTTLNYYEDDHSISYPLGKISFIYENEDSIYLTHGCDTTIQNGQAVFTFLADNSEPFTITKLLMAEDEKVSYSYDKNISYTPGTELPFVLNIDYSVNDGDIFIIQPIFEVTVDGGKTTRYFTPNIPVYSGHDLTYLEIKEYVQ